LHSVNHILNFSKKEHLKSEKAIDLLFRQGKSKTHGPLRMVYQYTDDELPLSVKVMFSAPKKNFKSAVKRNLLKRRMREAYRLNKYELISIQTEKRMNILLAFLYVEFEIKPFADIEKSMKHLINFLLSK
jgi:ribonuclease P protein component